MDSADWILKFSKSQQSFYYFNQKTNESTWENPHKSNNQDTINNNWIRLYSEKDKEFYFFNKITN